MKTILDALRDEIHSPVGDGHLTNRLMMRGLNPDECCTVTVMRGNAFQGAIADCLIALLEMPNISEGDKRFDLANRELIIRRANAIYRAIGETELEKKADKPTVYIGE